MERTYTQSDLNAALVAMVEKCAAKLRQAVAAARCEVFTDENGTKCHQYLGMAQSESNKAIERIINDILAILPADILASVEVWKVKLRGEGYRDCLEVRKLKDGPAVERDRQEKK